jgi:hypothetical protein
VLQNIFVVDLYDVSNPFHMSAHAFALVLIAILIEPLSI